LGRRVSTVIEPLWPPQAVVELSRNSHGGYPAGRRYVLRDLAPSSSFIRRLWSRTYKNQRQP
jgi:hypothetical protein